MRAFTNIDKKENEWKQITEAFLTKKHVEVIKITHEGKSIVCTPDHKIFTENRGYVEAKDLKEDDELNFL